MPKPQEPEQLLFDFELEKSSQDFCGLYVHTPAADAFAQEMEEWAKRSLENSGGKMINQAA